MIDLLATAARGAAVLGTPQDDGQRSVLASMFDYENAGPIGYAIVGMSVVALALILENFVTLRRDRLAPLPLLDQLETLFDEQNFTGAAELCEQQPNYLSRCVAAGLGKIGQPFDTMQITLREMETEESVRLFQKIGWLSLLAAVAPLMGLFGTVTGMFVTFDRIAQAGGQVNPSTLAGGIKMALITTIFGLSVAIPAGVAYFALKNRVIRIATEVNALAEDLFERFRQRH